MKNFQQHGDTIEFVAGAAITAGDPVELTDLLAVAVDDVANGDTGVGYTKGVFTLPKVSADVVTQGQQLYIAAGELTTSDGTGANMPAGKAWEAAGNGDVEIACSINV